MPFGEAIHPTVVVLALDGATSQQFAIASGFIENWKTSKEFTLAVAADMPETQIWEDKTPVLPAPKEWNKAAIIDP